MRSYLIGTLGDDISKGVRALREGKDFSSYVVAEFYDDIKDEHFCAGMVVDVFADGSDERKRWFVLNDVIPSCQMIADGRTVDSASFIKWCRQRYNTNDFQSFDTSKGFNQRFLNRTRVFDPKLIPLMQRAISFEPINNIEQFITTNICDIEENIDTVGMQEDIRNYQRTEEQAQIMEQRMSALGEIHGKYSEVLTYRARKKLQQFYIDYEKYRDELEKYEADKAQKEHLEKEVEEYDRELASIIAESEKLEEENGRLNEERARFLSESRKELLEKDKLDAVKDIENARDREKRLISKIGIGVNTWHGKCNIAFGEMKEEADIAAMEKLIKQLKKLSGFSERSIGDTSVKYFSDIKDDHDAVLEKAKDILNAHNASFQGLKAEKDLIEEQIGVLRKGKKPYPEKALKLKAAISKGLSEKHRREINAEFLADMIDITDEEWKNAVEGVLGNGRMDIIVPPELFMDAFYIYKRVRNELKVHEYAVIDLEKVFVDGHKVIANSLAGVVSCEDKYVRAYIDFLLGRVVRCYDDEKIRENRVSVTRDCMLYRNYAVRPINPFFYNTPYIGQKSIEIQLQQKEEQLVLVNEQIKEISSHIRDLRSFCDAEWFISQDFLDDVASPAFEAFGKLPALRSRLDEINEKLSRIDSTRLNEIEEKLRQNKKQRDENRKLEKEAGSKKAVAESKIENLAEKIFPEHERRLDAHNTLISEHYDEEYINLTAKPEFEKKLAQYGTPAQSAAAFVSPLKQTETSLEKTENELREKRSKYNQDFHFSFNISSADNDEFENEYTKISEIELPAFKERIAKAKETAMESFRNDFVNKLKSHITAVIDQLKDLNGALKKAKFGNNTYEFEWKPNPDYFPYYDMIMSAEEGETLFSYDFRTKYKDTIDNLFSQLEVMDSTDSAAAEAAHKLSRYSTYLSFDILSIDSNGITERLSKTLSSKSGGEIQTPFYVAMLIEDVLAALRLIYALKDRSVPVRAASVKLYNNSKRFENDIKKYIIAIARKFEPTISDIDEEDVSEREILSQLGIKRISEVFEFCGNVKIFFNAGAVDYSPIRNGACITEDCLSEIEKIELRGVRHVIFIENKTNYTEYCLNDRKENELVIMHGGLYSPARGAFFRLLSNAVKAESFYYWGDIDLGGFKMYLRLKENIFPGLLPYNMDVQCFERYKNSGFKRSEEYLCKISKYLNSERYSGFYDVMRLILENGVTIEQESFLDRSSALVGNTDLTRQ